MAAMSCTVVRLAAATALLATTIACGDDEPTGSGGLTGRYKMTTVDTRPLPLYWDCGGEPVATCTASMADWDRLDEVTLELTGNASRGDFTMTINSTERISGGAPDPQSVPVTGSYTVSGNTLTFTSALVGGSIAVTRDGDKLRTMLDFDEDIDDDEVVFVKQ